MGDVRSCSRSRIGVIRGDTVIRYGQSAATHALQNSSDFEAMPIKAWKEAEVVLEYAVERLLFVTVDGTHIKLRGDPNISYWRFFDFLFFDFSKNFDTTQFRKFRDGDSEISSYVKPTSLSPFPLQLPK